MFSVGMAIPYFANLFTSSKILHFLLSIPSSAFSYIVALILSIFFLRLIFYVLIALKIWKKKEKITFEDLQKISQATNQKIPFFSILIPALNETDVIYNTIIRIANINYPRNYYQIMVVVDEKERLKAKPNQITTKDVVIQSQEKLKQQLPDLNLTWVEVPYDFDGNLHGQCLNQEVPSTKGRGLNYAFSFVDKQTDFCAFFDAEAGPNPDSFLAVAKSYLTNNQNTIFQLPVFQIRNFWSLSPFCKIAALAQCFSHQYALPFIFLFLPFVGGTNFFIKRDIFEKLGGFDNHILTEDAEIGIRGYLKYGYWPVFLPYPSTEQTPATRSGYHRQRYRWGYGFMQTLQKVIRERGSATKKRYRRMLINLIIHGPFDWIIYYPLTLAATLLFILRVFKSLFTFFILYRLSILTVMPWNPLNDVLSLIIVFIPIPSLLFLSFLIKHYWPHINFYGIDKKQIKKQFSQFAVYILCFAPLLMSFYVFPYLHAFIDFLRNPQKKERWVKTERTQEKHISI